MSLRSSVSDQHLHHKEEQRDAKEVHELLVVLLEDDRTVHLVLHPLEVIDDRIESELAVSGTEIDSVTCSSNILKHLLIKSGNDDLAVLVLQKFTVHRNRLTLRRTNTDSEHSDAKLRSLLCSSNGIILMVLTVSDDNHRTALLALRAETPDRSVDGLSDGSSLNRNRLRRYRIEEHLG